MLVDISRNDRERRKISGGGGGYAPPMATQLQVADLEDLRPADEDPVRRSAEWVRAVLRAGLLELPGWASGMARQRLGALQTLGRADLDLARLAEGHVDAVTVLDELAGPEPGDGLWALWAANPPVDRVRAEPDASAPDGWLLSGTKPWCSGAGCADRALVTAEAPDGYRLFALDLHGPEVQVVPGSWPAPAMRGSDSRSVELTGQPATPVGAPGAYLDRAGFWPGAVGVAAVWLGGAQAVAARLAVAHARRPLDPHGLAHAGAADAALGAAEAVLSWAGDEIDADPDDRAGRAHLVAARARAVVEETVGAVVGRVGRALGAGPLAQDARHGQRVADLGLYVRQSHAERDLEELGRLALGDAGRSW